MAGKQRVAKTNGGLNPRLVGGLVAALLLVAGVGYLIFRPSPDSVLNSPSLTPRQIRYVATKLLVDDDVKLRARASEKLISLRDPAVPVLKEISLEPTDPGVREAVLKVLAAISPPAATEVLTKLITDPNPEVRRIAVTAAVRLPEKDADPIVQKAASDADTGVRLAAMDWLARRKSAKNVPLLQQALQDSDITVRRHAAHTLQTITGKDYRDQVRGR